METVPVPTFSLIPVPGHIKNRLNKIKRERNCQTANQIENKPAGCQSEKETVILQASKRASHLQRRKINTKTATPMRERQINSQSVNESGKQSIFNQQINSLVR